MTWHIEADAKPQRATPVLVTVELRRAKKRVVAIGTWWTKGKGHDGDAGWEVDGYEVELMGRVVAWQPLPPFAA